MKTDVLEAGSATGRWCCWAGCFAGSRWSSRPRWPGSRWSAGGEPPWTHATGSCQWCFPRWWRTRPSGSPAWPKPWEALELCGEKGWSQSAKSRKICLLVYALVESDTLWHLYSPCETRANSGQPNYELNSAWSVQWKQNPFARSVKAH